MLIGVNESTGARQEIKVTASGALLAVTALDNALIQSSTAAWANSAAAATAVAIDVALPVALQSDGKYLITVINPSTVTDLVVSICDKATISATAHYPELALFTVAKNTKRTALVEGWLLMEAGRLSITNTTVLGVADGFTANVLITRV